MQNGYFRLESTGMGGYGVKIVPPVDGGENVRINEVTDYLTFRSLTCDFSALRRAIDSGQEQIVAIATGNCPSEAAAVFVSVSEDSMEASIRIIPPSETGPKPSVFDIMDELRRRQVVYGVKEGRITKYLEQGVYCTDFVAAQGLPPVHGEDARIEYFFNTDLDSRPVLREDGSVDFFNLNTISHCRQGQVLAKLIPETKGEYGINVLGAKIKPRDVKKAALKYSNNIELSEDGTELISLVDGHVNLIDGKVFVSNVFDVKNVDTSTGNIDYDGSIKISGNVQSNFSVKSRGNIVVDGIVEGAYLEAGGDIIIARGMNGMSKGVLKAGGNIVVKYLENASVEAGGYVQAEAIIHSTVMAGTEVIVDGKRGSIAGGRVYATSKVSAKHIGSEMGVSTIIEVGVNPAVKARYAQVQKEVMEAAHELKTVEPVIMTYLQKKKQGEQLTLQQTLYLKSLLDKREESRAKLESLNDEMLTTQAMLERQGEAQVIVTGDVYPGVKIGIGEVSMVVQSNMTYCKFIKLRGDVKMVGL